MTTKTLTLTPFTRSEYFRNHAPSSARRGMRGYVLMILGDMMRLNGPNVGTCWPSIDYLAKMIGRSTRQVQRLLRELEKLGEVQRIAQKRTDGGYSSNLYRLKGLISWATKNVTPPGDTRTTKTSSKRTITPARGVNRDSRGKKRTAPYHPAPASVPLARAEVAEKGPSGFLSDSAPSPAPKRGLSVEQIEEARAKCDPVRWAQLLIEAGMDGATGADLDHGAARRWRADAIMARVPLVA